MRNGMLRWVEVSLVVVGLLMMPRQRSRRARLRER